MKSPSVGWRVRHGVRSFVVTRERRRPYARARSEKQYDSRRYRHANNRVKRTVSFHVVNSIVRRAAVHARVRRRDRRTTWTNRQRSSRGVDRYTGSRADEGLPEDVFSMARRRRFPREMFREFEQRRLFCGLLLPRPVLETGFTLARRKSRKPSLKTGDSLATGGRPFPWNFRYFLYWFLRLSDVYYVVEMF